MTEAGLAMLDDDTLDRLLHVAMTDADPREVMAPMPGDPSWTAERIAAFVDGHRECRRGADEATRQVTLAVLHDGAVAGSVRFAPVGGDAARREIGLWLGRSHRGHGVSTAVLRLGAEFVRDELGAREIVADTSATNRPAIAALRRAGYTLDVAPDRHVRASRELRSSPRPGR